VTEKLAWHGELLSVQPRIRLLRSFDERHHNYLGYCLRIRGELDELIGEFLIGIGGAAQGKHLFRNGDVAKGVSVPVRDPRLEPAEYYMTSELELISRSERPPLNPPPWLGPPPTLEVYRGRGHRRLDPRTYESKCTSCIWGCRMPVEMIVDHWNPTDRRYRVETFCYGPKSCAFYRAGATRKVPGRKGMSWEEEDWVDEDATEHRGPDE
jgi:hypothetical protein